MVASKELPWSHDNASFKRRFDTLAQVEFPYGHTIELEQAPGSLAEDQATIWDSAFVLGALLQNKEVFPAEYFSGKSVVELGSGTGLVGIMAARLGAKAVLTDLAPILPLLQRNIDRNVPGAGAGGAAEARECSWGETDVSSWQEAPFDVLLGSDIQPFVQDQEALVETMAALASPQTDVWIGLKHRWKDVDKWFMEEVDKHFDHSPVPPRHFVPPWAADDIEVLRLRKRAE